MKFHKFLFFHGILLDFNYSPLLIAGNSGNLEIVKLLIEAKHININYLNI